MHIYGLLNQIKSGEIVLPAIQRDFVWSEEKVTKLLDSVMRGYPIGIALLWETYEDVQYRSFVDSYDDGDVIHDFRDNSKKRKLKVVLDGQQRLQSLYIALYGRMNGRQLYFDMLSGRDADNLADNKYEFLFGTEKEIRDLNESAEELREIKEDEPAMFYQRVSALFAMRAIDQQKLRKDIATKLGLSDGDQLRLDLNLSRFKEAFSTDENIFLALTIDENVPRDAEDRKSEADVLEIFVRINRQGTALSRSDLVFSLLKLNWKESAESLPDFVASVNKGNSFEIDNDFVIRCLMAVSEFGTKFDLEQLRSKQKIETLKNNFERCCDAIRATVDFVMRECHCQSGDLIGGNTLVPFVYYLFHCKKHEIKDAQLMATKKAFYLLALTKPLSRYGDSRVWAIIRDDLMPLAKKNIEVFPFKKVVSRVKEWGRVERFDESLVQQNVHLALHLLQGLSGAQVQYSGNEPQVDHIFPRSILKEKGFEGSEVNSFGNYWILAKGKNLNKTNMPPADYFKDVHDSVLKKALINRDMLEYRSFRKFLTERKSKVVEQLKKDLHFSDADFQMSVEAGN